MQCTIAESYRGTLQECGSPSPGRDDGAGYKTRLDRAASSRKHLRGLQLIVVAFEDPCREDLGMSISVSYPAMELVRYENLPFQEQKGIRYQERCHIPKPAPRAKPKVQRVCRHLPF